MADVRAVARVIVLDNVLVVARVILLVDVRVVDRVFVMVDDSVVLVYIRGVARIIVFWK